MYTNQIFGIILLLLIFGPLIYIVILSLKQRKKLINQIETNSHNIEIIRVQLSRKGLPDSLKNNPTEKKFVYLLLIIIFIIFFGGFLNIKYKINFLIIILIILPLIIFAFYLIAKNTNYSKNTKIYLSNHIHKNYSKIKEIPVSRKEIISGSKDEIGNIREVDLYSCFIKEYNCFIKVYYEEILDRVDHSDHYYYSYTKSHKYISYDYNIKSLNLDINLNSNIFKNKLNNLLTKKIIKKIDFINNHFIIVKETVLNGYQDIDAKNDCDDIKLFYEELIQFFKEEK